MSTPDLIRSAHAFAGTSPDALLLDHHSLGALLNQRTTEQPDALLLKFFDDDTGETASYSYSQFAQLVEQAAGFLASHGLEAGDCFATLSHNHPMGAVLLFAGWKLGLIVAPQNVSEDDARIAFILRDASAKLCIAHPGMMARATQLASAAPGVQHTLSFDDVLATETPHKSLKVIRQAHHERNLQFTVRPEPVEGLNRRLPDQTKAPRSKEDYRRHPALIVYTSGTTGNPKGVMLTQYNLMINAQGIAIWHELDANTRLMCVLPIHHVNGIVVTLVATVVAGAALVLNRSFKVSTFWKRLAEEGVAIVSVVPTILQFLCEAHEDVSSLDLSRFRHFICGAGTLPISLVEKFDAKFGLSILHGYGLSETTAFTCTMPVELPRKTRQHWLCGHGYPSIGTVFPHCEMAIHDPDGRSLPKGERGEIVIRGHYIMAGYHHRPDANADAFKHGWFRSGDEGFFETDASGRQFFFITGRLKELINRGGVKYSPFEIEEVLLSIPGVKVGLAIAFDNEWYGEEVGAYIVRETHAAITADEILAACRSLIPFSKCPKAVVFGNEVPITVTGKYQRLKLKVLFGEHAKTQFRQ